jgi:hypothetical protein
VRRLDRTRFSRQIRIAWDPNPETTMRSAPRFGLLLCLVFISCGGEPEAERVPDAPPAARPPETQIVPTLSPTTGSTGSQVTLTASGLPAGAAVEIGFGAPQENFEVLTQATVDAQGNLSSVVTVPTWAVAGRGYHFSVAPVNQPPIALSRVFNVTAR